MQQLYTLAVCLEGQLRAYQDSCKQHADAMELLKCAGFPTTPSVPMERRRSQEERCLLKQANYEK